MLIVQCVCVCVDISLKTDLFSAKEQGLRTNAATTGGPAGNFIQQYCTQKLLCCVETRPRVDVFRRFLNCLYKKFKTVSSWYELGIFSRNSTSARNNFTKFLVYRKQNNNDIVKTFQDSRKKLTKQTYYSNFGKKKMRASQSSGYKIYIFFI